MLSDTNLVYSAAGPPVVVSIKMCIFLRSWNTKHIALWCFVSSFYARPIVTYEFIGHRIGKD